MKQLHRISLIQLFILPVMLVLPVLSAAQNSSAAASQRWPDEQQCRENPEAGTEDNALTRGWCLAIDRNQGNCIACHTLNVSPWPQSLPVAGNIAPPLVAMQPRFPDLQALRKQIEDAPALNPHSTMPPYLRHELLSEEEIDQLITFLMTL